MTVELVTDVCLHFVYLADAQQKSPRITQACILIIQKRTKSEVQQPLIIKSKRQTKLVVLHGQFNDTIVLQKELLLGEHPGEVSQHVY